MFIAFLYDHMIILLDFTASNTAHLNGAFSTLRYSVTQAAAIIGYDEMLFNEYAMNDDIILLKNPSIGLLLICISRPR